MVPIFVRIRHARTKATLTQTELARRLGVQRSAVTQWERSAGTTPSVSHLSQIASETRVCFEWLATGRGPPSPIDGTFDEAVVLNDYAHDELEGRVLAALRRVGGRRRETVVRVVELLSS
ncbi:hypothetical protein LYSHEL_21660 [Lysobacter helvus]|uniref:HTH cro/C1-type domain-containing protein n=2 Tax=Lysobacteraceae TaxID=32033 RepID=A0ABN6FU05_9GAMM|nr:MULTISPECIES: helix-turn-helix transcriptional regulator [Lysobacter]BCT93143.1 hypothetical protein LYSCAS_21670 [Lysobacter caseinilyticus]BCT96295.1 hypothetical protein LYSHEL_21660 [Lysobacter helvus]